MKTLIRQSCPQGLTGWDLKELLGMRLEEFWGWMRGQTMALCDGWQYNHGEKMYEPTACQGHAHGVVVYLSDVERFLRGLPVID